VPLRRKDNDICKAISHRLDGGFNDANGEPTVMVRNFIAQRGGKVALQTSIDFLIERCIELVLRNLHRDLNQLTRRVIDKVELEREATRKTRIRRH
jgi:hypothetical protein